MADGTEATMIERLVRVERDVAVCGREIGEMKKKMDDLSAIISQLKDMNGNIMVLAEQVKTLAGASNKLEERMAAVEAKPARRWDAIVGALIAALVSGVVGVGIGLLTRGGV